MNWLEKWEKKRDRVLVMGVLNLTPDSFYDGGSYPTQRAAVNRALEMVDEGADIIDIGGESSRPGAAPVSEREELGRVLPVIKRIRKQSEIMLSIDTTKATVAAEAIACGTTIVNDISALRSDPGMARVIARNKVFLVLMHMQGTPRTMQHDPIYGDPVREISGFLQERIKVALGASIPCQRIIVDPGIGFGKKLEHNLVILQNLNRFATLEVPILVGLSRKSFIGEILGSSAEDRLTATIAANAIAVANGANIIRVHDVKEGRRTADVACRLRRRNA